jgi:hypothetical protein
MIPNIHQIARGLEAQTKRAGGTAEFNEGGVRVIAYGNRKTEYYVYGRKTRAMMAQAVLETLYRRNEL